MILTDIPVRLGGREFGFEDGLLLLRELFTVFVIVVVAVVFVVAAVEFDSS